MHVETAGPKPMMAVPSRSWRRPRPMLVIVFCAVMIRVLYFFLYLPWWLGDTPTYIDAGYLLRHGYFTDGARPPVYPLFLNLARWMTHQPWQYFDPASAVVVTTMQAALGVLACVLVYDILRKLRVRRSVAFAGALFFTLLNGVCEWEMVVLAQSLSLFALVLAIWLYVTTLARVEQRRKTIAWAIGTGLAFSFATLVRGENLAFCGVLMAVAAWLWLSSSDPTFRRAFRNVALVMPLAAAPLLLAWMTWNYIGIGRFQITTLASWNINSSMYNMFDRVGPEDRVLGELLVKADLIRNHPEKIPNEKFWLPTPPGEIIQNTYPAVLDQIVRRRHEMPLPPPARPGKFGAWLQSFASEDARRYTHSRATSVPIPEVPERQPNDIGDYVSQVSWKLIRHYPVAWLRNAAANFGREAFRYSFAPPAVDGHREPASFDGGPVVRSAALRVVALWLNRIEAPIMTLLFVLTLGLAGCAPWIGFGKRRPNAIRDAAVAAMAVGVAGVIAVCCLLACYVPHYGIPHWPAIVICGVYGIDRVLPRRTELSLSE